MSKVKITMENGKEFIIEVFKGTDGVILKLAKVFQPFQGGKIGALGTGYPSLASSVQPIQIFIHLLVHMGDGLKVRTFTCLFSDGSFTDTLRSKILTHFSQFPIGLTDRGFYIVQLLVKLC